MLEGLFDEDAAAYEATQEGNSAACSIPRPIPPRGKTALCGLSNLGATCYMNALLQTLYFTPELRESLFALTDAELGIGQDEAMLRAIPVQLQSLFSRMLLVDQDSVGVEGLISSFGWTNNEEMQQHDVQELNRILFDALESSLVGTSGERLISQLYHGTSVQQITCERCNGVSEREEEFLDIPVPLTDRSGLEESLKLMYCDVELLNGNNQYHCETCGCFVDAKRSCSLRKLPPILTFALLRFLYDFNKGQRYKDLSNFKFPLSLNMTPYLDKSDDETDQELVYDLFSIVIHSGSTHSGHYVAYIKDIDALGNWTCPENEPVYYQKSNSTDILEVQTPLELISAILEQCDGRTTVSNIGKKLQEQTGVTWNKRFKHNYGPITKFIKQHSEIFDVDSSNTVLLKSLTTSATQSNEFEVHKTDKNKENFQPRSNAGTSKKDVPPPPGQCWFEFNDSHVSSLSSQSIEKMFSGRQSAYMLFYRLRSLTRPQEAFRNPLYGVPKRLQDEVAAVNSVLMADREHYDNVINMITLTIHPSPYYRFIDGALQNVMNDLTHMVEIDRRKTVAELQVLLLEEIGEPVSIQGGMVIHVAKPVPAGLHLYECITSNDDMVRLMDKDIVKNCHLFVWDGLTVEGQVIPVGKDHEPVLLHLNYPDSDGSSIEVSAGFSRQMTLLELRKHFASLLNCTHADLILSQVEKSRRSGGASIASLPSTKDSSTLSQLLLDNGVHITAELKVKKGYKSFAHSVADKQNKMLTFLVENRCTPTEDYSIYPVEVGKNEQLKQVKNHILSQLKLSDIEGGGRLRIDDDIQGLGPPLCEEQSLVSAGIEPGIRVILEPGTAPSDNQVFLKCAIGGSKTKSSDIDFRELIVDRSTTVKECCATVVDLFGLIGNEWHLCKTNWCGEVGDMLDDETATVKGLNLRSGDCLLVESGRLPPKGYVRISIYLYELDQPIIGDDEIMDWFKRKTKVVGTKREAEDDTEVMESEDNDEVPLHEQDHTLHYPQLSGSLTFLNDVEISRDSTVDELKELILTLPQLSSANISSTDFVRVRDLINGRPGRIFKDKSHQIKRFKLVSGAKICCQVLSYEEFLSPSSIVFNLHLRQSITKTCSHPVEVAYDTAVSNTPSGLRNHVSYLLAMPPERLVLAKHKFESFQWIIMEDSNSPNEKGKKGRRRGKGGGGAKGGAKSGTHINIKNAPISLRDGDIVAVKDSEDDPDDIDDFTTLSDEKGRAILAAVQEEKRQRRKAKYEDDDNSDGNKKRKQRRPEIGIKIFVPDFSQQQVLHQSK